MTVAIVALVLCLAAAVNWLLPLLLGLSLPLRIAVVVVLLLPTGIVLGMPFPTGMRVVERQCPHLLPWGWAVNAFCSVFASIFCIVLSMGIGFTSVLLLSAVIYVVGLSGLRIAAPSTSSTLVGTQGADALHPSSPWAASWRVFRSIGKFGAMEG